MKNSEGLERNLQLLTLFRMLLVAFAFDVPVIVLLWQSCGLSMADIMLLQSLFAIALALLEVPSGYFADRVGRRASLLFGAGCLCVGAGCYLFADSFTLFLAAELLLAAGFAFASGSDQALFHDSLIALGREGESTERWGKMQSGMFAFSAVAGMLGGFLGAYDLRLPLVLTFGGTVVLIGVAKLMVEPKRSEEVTTGRGSLSDLTAIAVETMLKNPRTRWLMVYPAVILAVMQAGLWLYQPYFLLSGLPVALFGVVFALCNVAAAFAARRVNGERSVDIERRVAVSGIALVALSYLLLGSFVMVLSSLFILLQQWVRGFVSVAFTDGLNREVGSERRATILSLQSMLQRLVYAALIVPIGIYADEMGVLSTLTLLGGIAILSGAAVLLLFQRGEQE